MIAMEHTIGSSPSRSRITECYRVVGKGGEGGSHPQYPGVENHVKESNRAISTHHSGEVRSSCCVGSLAGPGG